MLNKSTVVSLLALMALSAYPGDEACAGNLVTFNVNLDVQRLCKDKEFDGTPGNVVDATSGPVASELCTIDEAVEAIVPVCCVYGQGGSGQCARDFFAVSSTGPVVNSENPSLIFAAKAGTYAVPPDLLGTLADGNFGKVGPVSVVITEEAISTPAAGGTIGITEDVKAGQGLRNALAAGDPSERPEQKIARYLAQNPPNSWVCELVVDGESAAGGPGFKGDGSFFMMGDTTAAFARTRPGTVLINRLSGAVK